MILTTGDDYTSTVFYNRTPDRGQSTDGQVWMARGSYQPIDVCPQNRSAEGSTSDKMVALTGLLSNPDATE